MHYAQEMNLKNNSQPRRTSSLKSPRRNAPLLGRKPDPTFVTQSSQKRSDGTYLQLLDQHQQQLKFHFLQNRVVEIFLK